MNLYRAIQITIILIMMVAWVTTGAICIIHPDPSDFIVNLYGKLEAVFFTLASLKTLEVAISKANGGGNDKNGSTAGGSADNGLLDGKSQNS